MSFRNKRTKRGKNNLLRAPKVEVLSSAGHVFVCGEDGSHELSCAYYLGDPVIYFYFFHHVRNPSAGSKGKYNVTKRAERALPVTSHESQ